MKISEDRAMKMISSMGYNFIFNKVNGFMMRWGKTEEDNPDFSPFGPEILDIEISSSVPMEEKPLYDCTRLVEDGGCKGECPMCYKSNGKYPTYNMTLDEFKVVFHKMANTMMVNGEEVNASPLTQIAFGIMNLDTNPDFFAMAEYSREHGVIPNFTMHGLDNIDEQLARRIVLLFGACAVSVYNKEKSYNVIKSLTKAAKVYNPNFKVNIHAILSQETLKRVYSIIDDSKKDKRLEDLNAIVILSLKQKGNGEKFNRVNDKDFDDLVKYIFDSKVSIGFDSCTCNKFIESAKKVRNIDDIIDSCEPCESGMFSSYVNCKGEYFPCSFCERSTEKWMEGMNVLKCESFIKDIWSSENVKEWRNKLVACNRSCPIFNV